jgi:hypothetical protein
MTTRALGTLEAIAEENLLASDEVYSVVDLRPRSMDGVKRKNHIFLLVGGGGGGYLLTGTYLVGLDMEW